MNSLLPVCNAVFSDKAEISRSFEAFLPEYCPGIQKITKTTADFFAQDAYLSDGLITVKMKANICITYFSETNGLLKTVCFPYETEHSFDASRISLSDSSPVLEAKACLINATPKQKGTRSAEIKMVIFVCASLFECYDTQLYSGSSGADIELRMCQTPVTSRTMIAEKKNPVQHDIVLDSTMPQIAEIINFSCNLLTESTEISDNTLKYNGKMVFKCTYRAENDSSTEETEYINFINDIPFSGEITNDNINNNCIAIGKLVQTECEAGSSFDPYGESRIINVSAQYEAAFDIFTENTVEYADDGYCAAYECNLNKNQYTCDEICSKINTDKQIKDKFSLNGKTLSNISDCDMRLCISGMEYSENIAFATGKAGVTVSGTDDKNEMCCIQSVINVRIPIEEIPENSDRKHVLTYQVKECSATLSGGEISIAASVHVEGVGLCKKTITAISDAEISYDFPKPLCHSEYIIYYPEKNEKLWDIAKRYEIPMNELAKANDIKDDSVKDRKTIIIPCRI